MSPPFTVKIVPWDSHRDKLSGIRETVFVIEQNVPPELEIDDLDSSCVHALAQDADGNSIGTARLLPDGKIGRVAVLIEWRKLGVGRELMRLLMDHARERGDNEILLHAQTSTVGFYESLGFEVEGEEFMEADIPHRTMRIVF